MRIREEAPVLHLGAPGQPATPPPRRRICMPPSHLHKARGRQVTEPTFPPCGRGSTFLCGQSWRRERVPDLGIPASLSLCGKPAPTLSANRCRGGAPRLQPKHRRLPAAPHSPGDSQAAAVGGAAADGQALARGTCTHPLPERAQECHEDTHTGPCTPHTGESWQVSGCQCGCKRAKTFQGKQGPTCLPPQWALEDTLGLSNRTLGSGHCWADAQAHSSALSVGTRGT